jgi:hypothetical protein
MAGVGRIELVAVPGALLVPTALPTTQANWTVPDDPAVKLMLVPEVLPWIEPPPLVIVHAYVLPAGSGVWVDAVRPVVPAVTKAGTVIVGVTGAGITVTRAVCVTTLPLEPETLRV